MSQPEREGSGKRKKGKEKKRGGDRRRRFFFYFLYLGVSRRECDERKVKKGEEGKKRKKPAFHSLTP